MISPKVLLVDKKDTLLGYDEVATAHRGQGVRHRAFVTLLFDSQNRVLLQKRKHKLFNGLWDLTAISHPLHIDGHDETYQEASDRALKKEMGIKSAKIKKIGAFNYFAQDGKNCENEYCAVLIGNFDGHVISNPQEVYEFKKITFKEFINDLKKHRSSYTPWALRAKPILEKYIKIDN